MNRLSFVPLIAIFASSLCAQVACCDEQDASQPPFTSQDKTTLSILDERGKPVFRYRFAEVVAKPYVDQLFSPGGVQVLRDSPHDHKHHHALMFAVAVDGVNFWEEHGEAFGRQRQRSLGKPFSSTRDGVRRDGFVEELDWIAPAADKSLLIERREIDSLAMPDQGATLLEWRCQLQPPEGKAEAKLEGRHYFGLGLRFVESMDRDARVFYAEGKQSEPGPDKSTLTYARWCALTAKAEGKPVTVAVFDHPSNPRPARWFAKDGGFSYLSATLNLWKEPLVVRAGEPLKLRYAVAVWDGEVEPATIERLHRRWVEASVK
jgi:hypothetical protein